MDEMEGDQTPQLSEDEYLGLLNDTADQGSDKSETEESSSIYADSSLLAAHVLELDEKVTGALEILEDLVEKVGGGEGKKRPRFYNWRYQASPELRRKLWNELRDFVDWINVEYFLYENHRAIPACWYRHKEAVHVLTSIWAAWISAYFSARSFPTNEAAIWHRDTLYPLLEALDTSFKQCQADGAHYDRMPLQVATDEGFEEFVGTDLSPESWAPGEIVQDLSKGKKIQ